MILLYNMKISNLTQAKCPFYLLQIHSKFVDPSTVLKPNINIYE